MKLLETELEIFPVGAIGAIAGEPGSLGVNFGKKRVHWVKRGHWVKMGEP
jgi:hypothetical protein